MAQKIGRNKIKNLMQVRQALELRLTGATFQEIGDQMSLSKVRAYQIVSEGMKDLDETCSILATETRRLMLDRIDAGILALWAERGNPRVSDSLVRLYDRQARLLGLDAPQKVANTDAAGCDYEEQARVSAIIRAKLLG
jgi:hypothetical protein